MAFLLAALLLLTACGKTAQGSWQEQYDLGMKYLDEGNYEEAILAFTAAIEIDPKRYEAYLGRGEAYLEITKQSLPEEAEAAEAYEKALADFLEVIALDDQVTEAYEKGAAVYEAMGDLEAAEDLLNQGAEATGNEGLLQGAQGGTGTGESGDPAGEDGGSTEGTASGEDGTGTDEGDSGPEKDKTEDSQPAEGQGDLHQLSLSNIQYTYQDGGYMTEQNPDAVGSMNLRFTVDGPENVTNVLVWTWSADGFGESELPELISSAEKVWQNGGGPMAGGQKVPFTGNGNFPVFAQSRNSSLDVLLIGVDENVHAVGYAIVTVEVP